MLVKVMGEQRVDIERVCDGKLSAVEKEIDSGLVWLLVWEGRNVDAALLVAGIGDFLNLLGGDWIS